MADSFHGVWLEIAVIGLVTSAASNALLSWAQCPVRCAPALAREGREGILHGTCEASESGWARVVRAELGEAAASPDANGDGPHREAPERRPTALMRAQPVAMSVVALAAASVGWRLHANARAATGALVSALHAVTSLPAARRSIPADAALGPPA